jgi:predicted lipid-binding transport protein (Tim44 family)
MNPLDLIILGVLVYFIYTRFTSTPLPKAKKKKSPVEIKVVKANSQSKEQIEQIFQKAKDMAEKAEAEQERKKNLEGLEKVKAFDKDFTEKKFLNGAEKAYQWYYDCLNEEKESDLENLLSPRIYSTVVDYFDNLDDADKKEIVEVKMLEKPSILDCKTIAKSAFIDVKYKAELLIKTIDNKTNEETTRTEIKDVIWTWGRNIISTDPNWQLDEIKNVS